LGLKGRRDVDELTTRSEKSAEAVVARDFGESGPLLSEGLNIEESEINRESWEGHASEVHAQFSDGARAGRRR